LFNSLVASGHPLRHFELPSGRYLPKAGPVGPAKTDYQTAETAVRTETIVGADDITFEWCRTGSNGLLDDRPIQPRGIHGGPFRGLPQKEDRMPANEHVPISLDEVTSEIATILARGFMRHRKGRHLAFDSDGGAAHVAQVEDSEALTEKRLDVSGHRSLHSFTS